MKIQNTEITNSHVGLEVTYYDENSYNNIQKGVITSFNDSFIFVKYDISSTSQATKANQLYWGDKVIELRLTNVILNFIGFKNLLSIIGYDDLDIEHDWLYSEFKFSISIKGEKLVELIGDLKYDGASTPVFIPDNDPSGYKLKEARRKVKLKLLLNNES